MEQIDRDTIECLKTWLSNRKQSTDGVDHYQSNVIIHPPIQLRSFGFPDLHLVRFNNSPIKFTHSGDLNKIFKWNSELIRLLRVNKCYLEAIELMRFNFDKKIAQYNVQEAINFVQGSLLYDVSYDARVNLTNKLTISDAQTPLQDIVSRLCICLFTSCPVKVVSRLSHYYNCLLSAYLVDMMFEAGVTAGNIQLFVDDPKRDSLLAPQNCTSNCGPPSLIKLARQSIISICFQDSNTHQASLGTLECYLRQVYHNNMIILVEESIHAVFISDWLSNCESLISNQNDYRKIEVDLNSIDMKSANRMTGNCINVVKFRCLNELCKLLSKLKKIPYVMMWTNKHLLAREICIKYFDQCCEFWINQLPANVLGRKFYDELLKYYKDSLKENRNETYSQVFHYHEEEIMDVRKLQAKFVSNKERESERITRVLRTYLKLVSKSKSAKQPTMSISESLAKMKRFHLSFSKSNGFISEIGNESRIETFVKPLGVAILVVRNESCVKSKYLLIEFIFKNLLLGNGVVLVCEKTLLGLRFPYDLMKENHLPFRLVDSKVICRRVVMDPVLPPESDLDLSDHSIPSHSQEQQQKLDCSIRSTDSGLNESIPLKQTCPKNMYAIDLKEIELTSDRVDALILALGSRRRSIWSANGILHCQPIDNSESNQQ